MNKTFVLFIALLLALPVLVNAQNDKTLSSPEIHKKLAFRDAGLLVVKIDQGAKVEISQGAGNVADITAFYQVKDKQHIAQLKKCSVTIENKGDSTVISSVCPADVKASDLQLKIVLPAKANINLIMSGGYLSINGITGKFDVSAFGGYYIFEKLTGVLHANLVGGKVRVANSTLDGTVALVGGTVEKDNVKGNLTTSK